MNEVDQQQAALFRRRRFAAPHRRRHPLRRLLRPLAAALAVVGLPATATWWVATSTQFEIGAIDVVATPHVPADWIGPRLDDLHQRHLLTVRMAEIEHRLAGHPWIADLVVRRELPGRLTVEVVERVPAGLWRDADGLFILDAAGRRIAPLDGDSGPLDLVVVSVAGAAEPPPTAAAAAIRVAERWESLRPGDQVSQIEILRSGDYRLVTGTLPFTLVVSPDRLETASAKLARVEPLIDSSQSPAPPTSSLPEASRLASADLRFSHRIVFQPAAEPPREEG